MPGNATLETGPALGALSTGVSSHTCNVPFNDSRVFLVTVYSSVCVLGLPANCLTAWLTLLQARQGHVLAVYLFCLALCELLYVSTLPLWVVYIQHGHRWPLSPLACKVTAYIFFCNLYISILFLCCISCDRFLAVVYALETRGRRHQKTAILISATVFLLVGLVHSPVFKMEHDETCFETLPMDHKVAGYYYARFMVGFAVPLSIIAVTNQRIFRTIQLSTSLSAAQKAKVRLLAIAVVVIFLVCFAPYHLVLLIKAIAFSYHRGAEEPVCDFEIRLYTASVVFLSLATVNSVADPIIYVLAAEVTRQEVCRIHKGWKKWSTKTDDTKLACSKDSEEAQSPMSPTNSYAFPGPVHPPGPSPGTPEGLAEGSC
ncbi:probable G-protein coupled receptor 132 [Cervus canadensis]|uniref:probable G-protein coupled receptor 132 n=1 Tax=Cervus canadensis TaxID=1574408 RepID=UPI001C9E329D|nr:probable G-protein coupled receptor 132 [Cervus canadensis]XP_043290337.1 probable G-protein coupled receptor 132 [Cervus canadensis]XP_043290338.1 probable G-protein coupled receptor 132 [Cervus canadensis]XP_043290339.1 probable G-protein coupled receptor 132 [Cervus canadensis]XP_043290340.1 probable G-protein coupled receptor 132 [Cervus canadensis]XP_043290341.1 probable G-protein coupled receptor 132 [Cervus canadensis]